jgi:RNA polymerase sigma-70 factor (ECF subfamily)
MIGDRDEAQECVQEAFVRAWQHRGKLSRAEHPDAWVRTTAYRLAVSRWRRKSLAKRPSDRALSPAVYTEPVNENRVALLAALQQLPDKQRQALVLHHLVDLPVIDVAREVGVPEGTIKARLSRGRTALAALLAPAGTDGVANGANHV